MQQMTPPRFFYHNFPRRGRNETSQIEWGLKILESIIDHGLLLVTEPVSIWKEDHSGAHDIRMCQARISFTELSPLEIVEHSKHFGSFALEFEISMLVRLGAIPLFYIPPPSGSNGYEGVGAAMIARLSEISNLLKRLTDIDKIICLQPMDQELVLLVNGNYIPFGCSVRSARLLLDLLLYESQPFEQLSNALGAVGGFFYPTDDPRYNDVLGYYRQREWRILADFSRLGVPSCKIATNAQQESLLSFDADFFGKMIQFEIGKPPQRRVDRCWFYKELGGSHVLTLARRILVPKPAVDRARLLMQRLPGAPPIEICPS